MGASPDAAQQTVFYDNTVASPSMKYEYDAIYRLTYAKGREHAGLIGDDQRDERDLPINNLPHANDMSAVRRYEETYEYDLVGNFESFAHVAVGNAGATWTRLYDYGVGKPNNRLQTNSLPGDTTAPYTAAYTYDDHGNCLSMPHLSTIDWDPSDQMQRADLGGGGEVFFTHDAAGQRVRKYRKHIGTLVEERIYLGAFELYRKRLSGTLQLERETLHVMDGVRRVAMIETKTVDTGVVGLVPTPRFRFQLGNHLETAHLEVDDTGLVISYEEMHPYGTSAYRSAASAVEVSARRYRYTGKERDDETGLDYFGARYYASWLGRWVSADPLGVQAGINLYLYCRAGPMVLVDPDGRDSTSVRQAVRSGLDAGRTSAGRAALPAQIDKGVVVGDEASSYLGIGLAIVTANPLVGLAAIASNPNEREQGRKYASGVVEAYKEHAATKINEKVAAFKTDAAGTARSELETVAGTAATLALGGPLAVPVLSALGLGGATGEAAVALPGVVTAPNMETAGRRSRPVLNAVGEVTAATLGAKELLAEGAIGKVAGSGNGPSGPGAPGGGPKGPGGDAGGGGSGRGTGASDSSEVFIRDRRTLQKMHDKHGADFGVSGKYKHGTNEADLSRAVHEHINSADTIKVPGEYRGRPVSFYLNPNSGVNAIASPSGELLGGWKLSATQQANLLFRGKVN